MQWRKNSSTAAQKAGGGLTAFIDEASEIEGIYRFAGIAMLNGKFTGEIATADTLIIGEKGMIRANIRAGVVLISGEVDGNITATDRVELRASAHVSGDVEAPVIVMEEGAVIEGHLRMGGAAVAEVTPTVPEGRTSPSAPRLQSVPTQMGDRGRLQGRG